LRELRFGSGPFWSGRRIAAYQRADEDECEHEKSKEKADCDERTFVERHAGGLLGYARAESLEVALERSRRPADTHARRHGDGHGRARLEGGLYPREVVI
jgi:hypothetical protein